MPLFPPPPMGPKRPMGPPGKGPGLMIALGLGKPKGPPMKAPKRPMPMGPPPSALSALSNGPVKPMAPSKKASFRK